MTGRTKPSNWMRGGWDRLPRQMRRGIVFCTGTVLISVGALLIVLPGPFTLPFVLLGLSILASEFVWARRILEKTMKSASNMGERVKRRRRRNRK